MTNLCMSVNFLRTFGTRETVAHLMRNFQCLHSLRQAQDCCIDLELICNSDHQHDAFQKRITQDVAGQMKMEETVEKTVEE